MIPDSKTNTGTAANDAYSTAAFGADNRMAATQSAYGSDGKNGGFGYGSAASGEVNGGFGYGSATGGEVNGGFEHGGEASGASAFGADNRMAATQSAYGSDGKNGGFEHGGEASGASAFGADNRMAATQSAYGSDSKNGGFEHGGDAGMEVDGADTAYGTAADAPGESAVNGVPDDTGCVQNTDGGLPRVSADTNDDGTDGALLRNDASENDSISDNAAARYEALMLDDLARLKAAFAECASLTSIAELSEPVRYAALRDMGLCAEEAYAAVNYRKRSGYDNRAHLRSAAQMASGAPSHMMTASELEGARELFGNLTDTEIASLYRRACGMKR